MAQEFADRNLLFGILAVQMDFVSRDALITGLNSWVLDKGRPLGRLLVEQGQLTPERLQLLDALVHEHLRAHGDDARHSLAAVASVASLRSALATLSGADLQANLRATGSVPTGEPATTDYRSFANQGTGQRYRILRPHAQGGIGVVFVAEDLELHREVALKEIRPDSADDPYSRARFLLEAEVTGALEHPGVVPVYGLGHYADGRPFYAMRFVKGDNLNEAIRRFHEADKPDRDAGDRALALRQLLRRFVDVCNAMAYAHSRGVLHRDLKPSNILLGRYGETLVVDWGLAKSVGRSDVDPTAEATLRPPSGSGVEATRVGTAVGTPAYMSPEQAAGQLDQLGPASDVYSLGATLYHLLTGKPPYRGGDAAEILEQVRGGALPPPRQLKPSTPAALEAICLKAMARDSASRYESALDLAEDIEHWLADEPVSAYPEPLNARGRRWARGHRTLVTGSAVGVLVAAISLAIATVLLLDANHRESAARRLAQTKSEEAVRERNQARTNFNLARDAVEEYCTKVSDDPRLKEKDLEGLRKELLESAVKFHQKFVDQQGDDPAVRADLTRAYLDLADITDDVGDKKQAFDFYRKAQPISEELVDQHPEEPNYRLYLGRAFIGQGCDLNYQGKPQEALTAFNQAATTLTEASERQGSPELFRNQLAYVYEQMASVLRDKLGQSDAAMGAIQKGLAQLDEGPGFPPLTEREVLLKVSLYSNLADVFNQRGQSQEALAMCDQASHILQPLLEKLTNKDFPYFTIHKVYYIQGVAYYLLKDWDHAIQSWNNAIEFDRRAVAEHSHISVYLVCLGSAYNAQSDALFAAGRAKDGEIALKNALEAKEKLVHDWPGVPDHEANLVRCLTNLSEHATDPVQAEAYLSRGAAIATHLTTDYPAVTQYQTALAENYCAKANLLLRKGNVADAAKSMQAAVEIMAKLVMTSNRLSFRTRLTQNCCNCAKLYQQVGNPESAVEVLRKGIAANDKDPMLFLTLGTVQANVQELDKASDSFRKAIALKADFAEAHCNLGLALLKDHQADGRAELQRSIECFRTELTQLAKRLADGMPQDRKDVKESLQRWLDDTDLAGVRTPDALKKLPVEEQNDWRKLWTDVTELLKKAEAAN